MQLLLLPQFPFSQTKCQNNFHGLGTTLQMVGFANKTFFCENRFLLPDPGWVFNFLSKDNNVNLNVENVTKLLTLIDIRELIHYFYSKKALLKTVV